MPFATAAQQLGAGWRRGRAGGACRCRRPALRWPCTVAACCAAMRGRCTIMAPQLPKANSLCCPTAAVSKWWYLALSCVIALLFSAYLVSWGWPGGWGRKALHAADSSAAPAEAAAPTADCRRRGWTTHAAPAPPRAPPSPIPCAPGLRHPAADRRQVGGAVTRRVRVCQPPALPGCGQPVFGHPEHRWHCVKQLRIMRLALLPTRPHPDGSGRPFADGRVAASRAARPANATHLISLTFVLRCSM